MAAKQQAALGFTVHIGRAAVVAVGGPVDAPADQEQAALVAWLVLATA